MHNSWSTSRHFTVHIFGNCEANFHSFSKILIAFAKAFKKEDKSSLTRSSQTNSLCTIVGQHLGTLQYTYLDIVKRIFIRFPKSGLRSTKHSKRKKSAPLRVTPRQIADAQ